LNEKHFLINYQKPERREFGEYCRGPGFEGFCPTIGQPLSVNPKDIYCKQIGAKIARKGLVLGRKEK
jgi:hypothetical protein